VVCPDSHSFQLNRLAFTIRRGITMKVLFVFFCTFLCTACTEAVERTEASKETFLNVCRYKMPEQGDLVVLNSDVVPELLEVKDIYFTSDVKDPADIIVELESPTRGIIETPCSNI